MRKSNFAPRLQSSLLDEARKLAEAEGVALNLINVAVAEKVSAFPPFTGRRPTAARLSARQHAPQRSSLYGDENGGDPGVRLRKRHQQKS
jgi:hypothetical protein